MKCRIIHNIESRGMYTTRSCRPTHLTSKKNWVGQIFLAYLAYGPIQALTPQPAGFRGLTHCGAD